MTRRTIRLSLFHLALLLVAWRLVGTLIGDRGNLPFVVAAVVFLELTLVVCWATSIAVAGYEGSRRPTFAAARDVGTRWGAIAALVLWAGLLLTWVVPALIAVWFFEPANVEYNLIGGRYAVLLLAAVVLLPGAAIAGAAGAVLGGVIGLDRPRPPALRTLESRRPHPRRRTDLPMPERLVVIGGDAAGMSAASEARRRRPAGDLEIVVFERSSYVSYSACGEPYFVGDYVTELDDLIARTPEQFAARDIEVQTRHEVTAIDTEARRVTVRPVDGGDDRTEPYDQLLIATGAEPNRPPIEGARLPGVYEMHTLDDALALRRLIDERRPRRAAVVGGGYIGIEMAEAFERHDIPTTIVTAAPFAARSRSSTPRWATSSAPPRRSEASRSSPGGASNTSRATTASPPSPATAPTRSRPTSSSSASAVTPRSGSRPRTASPSARAAPSSSTTTSAPPSPASGPPETAPRPVTASPVRPVNFHLGTVANKQGRIAGVNLGGGDEAFPGVLGTAVTKLCDLEIGRTGLTETECRSLGLDYVAETFESTTASGYWPEADRMTMKAIAHRGTRRLLGAQIVGGDSSAKRIDAVAMALWNEMTVDELINVDLSYAPPFSGVWDPVLVAARKLRATLGDPPPTEGARPSEGAR